VAAVDGALPAGKTGASDRFRFTQKSLRRRTHLTAAIKNAGIQFDLEGSIIQAAESGSNPTSASLDNWRVRRSRIEVFRSIALAQQPSAE
jgi:hypothetical protein